MCHCPWVQNYRSITCSFLTQLSPPLALHYLPSSFAGHVCQQVSSLSVPALPVCVRARHICLCRDQNTILRAHGGQSKNCFFKHTHFYSVQREKKEGIWLKGNCQYSGTDLYRCVQVSEGIDDVGVTSVGFLCTNRLTIPFNHTLPVAHTHTHTICSEDMYAQDSIDMLTQAGIQFKRHEEEGIEMSNFAELLTSSGLVLREEISWITFARSPQTSLSQHFMHTSLQVFYGKYQGAGAKLKLRGREFI